MLYLLFKDDPCKKVVCEVVSESCVAEQNEGICKCGKNNSCEGKLDGSHCDAYNSTCKCTAFLGSCSDITSPNCDKYANYGIGRCECSPEEESCIGRHFDRCINKTCVCGATGPKCKDVEYCVDGSCGKR